MSPVRNPFNQTQIIASDGIINFLQFQIGYRRLRNCMAVSFLLAKFQKPQVEKFCDVSYVKGLKPKKTNYKIVYTNFIKQITVKIYNMKNI